MPIKLLSFKLDLSPKFCTRQNSLIYYFPNPRDFHTILQHHISKASDVSFLSRWDRRFYQSSKINRTRTNNLCIYNRYNSIIIMITGSLWYLHAARQTFVHVMCFCLILILHSLLNSGFYFYALQSIFVSLPQMYLNFSACTAIFSSIKS